MCAKNMRRNGDGDETIKTGDIWNYQSAVLYGDGGVLAARLPGV